MSHTATAWPATPLLSTCSLVLWPDSIVWARHFPILFFMLLCSIVSEIVTRNCAWGRGRDYVLPRWKSQISQSGSCPCLQAIPCPHVEWQLSANGISVVHSAVVSHREELPLHCTRWDCTALHCEEVDEAWNKGHQTIIPLGVWAKAEKCSSPCLLPKKKKDFI